MSTIHRSQVSNELLDSTVRWESGREVIFRHLGRLDQADECQGLASIYSALHADLLEEHLSND